MADEPLSADELRALRVVDLKEKLIQIGLSVSGRKEDLVIRLSEHYESQGGAPNPEPVFVEVEGGSADGQGPDEELSNQESEEISQPVSEENSREQFYAEPEQDQEEHHPEQLPEGSSPDQEDDDRSQEQPELQAEQDEEVSQDEVQTNEPELVQVVDVNESGDEEQVERSEEPEVVDVDEPMETNVEEEEEERASVDSSVRTVPPPVVQTIRTSLFNAPFAAPAFAAAQPHPAGPPPSADEDLDGPPTPAGPIPKSKGPVPLMSLSVKPPPRSESPERRFRDDRSMSSSSAFLPKALEDALAFQTERAHQVGINRTEIDKESSEYGSRLSTSNVAKNISLVDEDDDDEAVESDAKRDKGKRQKKKKKKKRNRPEEWARQAAAEEERLRRENETSENDVKVEIEYIQEKLELDPSDPLYRQFAKIFETFRIDEDEEVKDVVKVEKLEVDEKSSKYSGIDEGDLTKVPKELELDETLEKMDDDEDGEHPKLSKRKLKKLSRLSVAELKQLVTRPDVVEMHDVTAKDPGLLVLLKSSRNTVPVPRHWCFKRKYLQGKRGIEKPPFELPDFIKKTGIMEMRAALQEKEDAKNLKSKMREKVRPKLGKIDIDYQKLHDAFFKWQTKPRMTSHGDLYYEGKEFEIRLKEKKPGELTDDLRTALGMPVGPNAHKVPPPWLIAMQRYGPPPSYPNLKIPGLNAAIPEGCSFGYHAGGWGKPPVDETGKPLYGDVFGTSDSGLSQQLQPEEIDQNLWGELESESEEEESDEDEDEEEEEQEDGDRTGLQTPIVDAGLATPSGMSSVGGLGLETPELIELRKRKIEADMEGGETPSLYTILPERHNERIGASMMGSAHTYDIPPPPPLPRGGAGRPPLPPSGPSGGMDLGGVELALNPEEVDLMDTDAMQAKAEAALRENQAMLAKEDLSDMVAEHAAKQSSKRKRNVGKEENKSGKKYKEFKF